MTDVISIINDLQHRIFELERRQQRVVLVNTALTSTSWDGDARSTTAKTLIDMSAVFSGYPTGARAVLVEVYLRDSGSAAGSPYMVLGYTNTADEGVVFSCRGLANDALTYDQKWVPCDANGDIYFQTAATGASTLDVWLTVRGWLQ